MTSTQYNSGRQLSSLDRIMAIDGRPYETDAITPCRETQPGPDNDLWFSPFRDKIRAIRACKECPFIGRCGYNAVVNRAQYGVWGGISLPGSDSTPDNLEDAYTFLLAQFERRLPVELGDEGKVGTSGVSIVLMSILSPLRSAFSAICADSRRANSSV